MIVPHSAFIEQQGTNLTPNDRIVRINVALGGSYATSPEHVRVIPMEVGLGRPDVPEDPAPDVIFPGFGENSLEFDLRVWTANQVSAP